MLRRQLSKAQITEITDEANNCSSLQLVRYKYFDLKRSYMYSYRCNELIAHTRINYKVILNLGNYTSIIVCIRKACTCAFN